MSNNPFDWRKNDWAPGMGRGGFVPKSIQKLSHKERVKMCKKLGHPVEAIELFTWEIDGIRIPGHIRSHISSISDLFHLEPRRNHCNCGIAFQV